MDKQIQEIKRLALSGDEANIKLAYQLSEGLGFDLLNWARKGYETTFGDVDLAKAFRVIIKEIFYYRITS